MDMHVSDSEGKQHSRKQQLHKQTGEEIASRECLSR